MESSYNLAYNAHRRAVASVANDLCCELSLHVLLLLVLKISITALFPHCFTALEDCVDAEVFSSHWVGFLMALVQWCCGASCFLAFLVFLRCMQESHTCTFLMTSSYLSIVHMPSPLLPLKNLSKCDCCARVDCLHSWVWKVLWRSQMPR